jgi:GT2 family glycosyltransferase
MSADMPEAPDLTVAIVSYNARDLLDACIRHVVATVREHTYEVIVADNASSDGSIELLRRAWPWVTVLQMSTNLGFAQANNRVLARARGRYVLLLNSDTEVLPGALDALLMFLEGHPHAGVAAPRLLNDDLSDQGTARAFPTPAAAVFGRKSWLTRAFPRNRWSTRYLTGRNQAGQTPFRVDWVSGACLMVRSEAIGRVGPLDEGFFMYWEDADWCRRIGAAGYDVMCVPCARVLHHEGGSSRGQPPHLVWTFHRSVYRYYAKHDAPQPWNPLRVVAAAGLTGRAALIVVMNLRARR